MKKRIIALVFTVILALSLCVFPQAEGEKNLVRGLDYEIGTGVPTDHSYMKYEEGGHGFFIDRGQLTDGRYASTDDNDANWFNAFRSQSCLVSFDLGKVCSVSEVKAYFLNDKGPGVYAPRYINVYLSEDGEGFEKVLSAETGFDLTVNIATRYTFEAGLPKKYAAKNIIFEFCSDVFAYCDEIEIFGSEELDGSEAKVKPEKEEEKGYFRELDGISDVIKIYNGYYPSNQEKATLTEEKLLPYVAYIDTEGNVIDTMFDAVAFVPCHTEYPSGGTLGKDGGIMSDWELYYDVTFTEGQDLYALDNVVGEVYGKLGIKDKFKVFLTLPYPAAMDKPFGDIDGDGMEEGCKTAQQRTDIEKWYILKCIKGFNDAKFQNLELEGFYWFREEVNYAAAGDEDVFLKSMNEYVHSKKLKTIYDPFYLSVGFDHWEELGFDSAVMQPNYAHREYFDVEMLPEFAAAARKEHIGTEMETEEPYVVRGDDYLIHGRKYESYMYYGAAEGYMDSFKTYYQGAGPGTIYDFCYADKTTPKGQYLRRLYDLTYKFIKGTYENLPPEITAGDIEVDKNDKRVSDITVSDGDSYWGDIEILFPENPKHGKVTASAGKKTLIYIPENDYVGEDEFTVMATDGFNFSEEITVHVRVNEQTTPDVSGASVSDVSGGEQENESMPNWLIFTLCGLGALIVVVAAIVIIKHAKKK